MDFSESKHKYTNLIEKNLSSFINKTINKIITFSIDEPEITAVLAFGSLAKKEMRNYSNINLVFLIQYPNESLFTSIKELIVETLIFSINDVEKMIFYVDYSSEVEQRIIEIEILLKNNIQDLRNLIIGSSLNISDIPNIVLFSSNQDLHNELKNILEENRIFKEDKTSIIIKLNNDFIHYFSKACFNIRKTDLYQYYVNLSKCYTTLARLDALKHNNTENINSPVYAFARIHLGKDFPFYRFNLPNISISDKQIRLEYISKYKELMEHLKEEYKLNVDMLSSLNFLRKLDEEIYFWNLRDISYLDQNHIKPGVFYRSSSLSRYNDHELLKSFLGNNNINTIIDLRSIEEVANGSYNRLKEYGISYINVPIIEKPNMDPKLLKYVKTGSLNAFYEFFLRCHQEEIKKIFESFANHDGAFVLHCYAGRDRTGVVVALLLEILGERSKEISDSLIMEDYLNSGNSTESEVFDIFTKTLKEFGGAKNYLQNEIGLSEVTIQNVIEKFTK